MIFWVFGDTYDKKIHMKSQDNIYGKSTWYKGQLQYNVDTFCKTVVAVYLLQTFT